MIAWSGIRNRTTGRRPSCDVRRRLRLVVSSRQWPSYPGVRPSARACVVALVELLLRAVAVVGPTGLEQLLGDVGVDVEALGLPVGAVRSAHLGALVPVEAEPAHHLEEGVVGLLGVPRGVGVLDPEDEGAAVVAGERPVEQRRAGQPDVRGAGRGGAEPDPDAGAVRGPAVI